MQIAPPPPGVAPPPPAAHKLPTMDFETYSEAGFTWDAAAGKWLKVGPKGGIADVGAWAYSRHPSTECLWLSYDLRDGKGVRDWMPWMPAPVELFDYVAQGGLIEAHNSFFEYCIWNNVFSRQMGAPRLPVDQLRDSAAACAAHGLPRSLEDAGRVMGCAQQKDTKAAAQVKKLWMPRKPTKADPSKRLTLEAQTELHLVNGAYCADDVRAEIALSDAVPHLSPYELEVWKLDQRINARGVGIDTDALNDAIAIVEQMRAKYVPMMPVLTNGEVKTPNSHAQLRDWCCRNGVEIPDTQADTITETLKRDDLPPHVRDVLEIRVMVGGAAINKVFAMQRFGDPDDGRVRGVFRYYGAVATGRYASLGVQLHNNPNSGPDHYKCGVCHEHYGMQATGCPHCGAATTGRADEWGNDAAESALRLFKRRDLALVEKVWGNALAIITACIRAFIAAAPGHDLICADYSAIEARVIAILAGEEWRLDVFRSHGKIYEMSAGKMLGLTMDDFKAYKEEHGSHHPARKKGKVAELACLGPHTQVLTNTGYVSIVDVTTDHLLWDGLSWVRHLGLIERGFRETVMMDGVELTPDHLVLAGDVWKEAAEVLSCQSTRALSLEAGSESLRYLRTSLREGLGEGVLSHAHVDATPTSCHSQTCTSGNQPDAVNAAGCEVGLRETSTTIGTKSGAQTQSIDEGSLTGCERPSLGATHRTAIATKITELEGLLFMQSGERNSELENSLSTSPPSKVGTSLARRWTESTSISDMVQEISDSCQEEKTCSTKGQSSRCKNESISWSHVYDLAHAGARNRFTIKTDSGHMVVHNCGYGGGWKAMAAFGADKFMTEKDMKDTVRQWRAASPNVAALWYNLEECAVNAVRNPGAVYTYRLLSYQVRNNVLYCRLPSGRELTYHSPRTTPVYVTWEETGRLEEDGSPERVRCEYPYPVEGGRLAYKLTHMGTPKKGAAGSWVVCNLYSGVLAENVCQAVARDLLADALLRLDKAGYSIIMHVHDEIIAEVPHGFGSVEEFEAIMEQTPHWAAGWPIKADGGWRGLRYRK